MARLVPSAGPAVPLTNPVALERPRWAGWLNDCPGRAPGVWGSLPPQDSLGPAGPCDQSSQAEEGPSYELPEATSVVVDARKHRSFLLHGRVGVLREFSRNQPETDWCGAVVSVASVPKRHHGP